LNVSWRDGEEEGLFGIILQIKRPLIYYPVNLMITIIKPSTGTLPAARRDVVSAHDDIIIIYSSMPLTQEVKTVFVILITVKLKVWPVLLVVNP
jgi:hypothetical protein